MFVLAHLSDPHLAPLPQPRWRELMGKRITGYLNWRRKRQLMHRSDLLAKVVADVKARMPDHIVVTGDLINISLAAEYGPARAWLASLGSPENVSLVPGNHDAYVRAAHPHLHWGDYMRGDDMDAVAFPFLRRRGPVAVIGLSSAVPTFRSWRPGGSVTRRWRGLRICSIVVPRSDCFGSWPFTIRHPAVQGAISSGCSTRQSCATCSHAMGRSWSFMAMITCGRKSR